MHSTLIGTTPGTPMADFTEGEEILTRAVKHLIDLDNGTFERLLMAVNEVHSLKMDYLDEDGVNLYLEIEGLFDHTATHETQGAYWQNLSQMSEDHKQELAGKILLLLKITCRAAVRQRKKS